MDPLSIYAEKYETDKATFHKFTSFYDKSLQSYRHNDNLTLVEMGVWKGDSIKMWSEYFPKGNIYGLDIDMSLYRHDRNCQRIHLIHCNAAKDESIQNALNQISQPIDIFIDDGGHTMEQQQVTLRQIFYKMKFPSVYILEDLHTSLMNPAAYNCRNAVTTLDVLQSLQKGEIMYTPWLSENFLFNMMRHIKSIQIITSRITGAFEPSITSIIEFQDCKFPKESEPADCIHRFINYKNENYVTHSNNSNSAFNVNKFNTNDSKNIQMVYYIYINPNKNWRPNILGQLDDIKNCSLLSDLSNILHCVICAHTQDLIDEVVHLINKELMPLHLSSRQVNFTTTKDNNAEYPGILKLHELSHIHPNDLFIYIHSKGMSHPHEERLSLEKTLLQSLVNPWQQVKQIFENNQQIKKAGLFPSPEGWIWFNFFWVRGDYIKDQCREPLKKTLEEKWYYENWIGREGSKTAEDCFSLITGKLNTKYTAEQASANIFNLAENYIQCFDLKSAARTKL